MSYTAVETYLGSTLLAHGFTQYRVEPDMTWRGSPAWAVYYRSSACKLQVCWAAREGGEEILLASLATPDKFGFDLNGPRWRSITGLVDTEADPGEPPAHGSGDAAQWNWDKRLLESHLDDAIAALIGTM